MQKITKKEFFEIPVVRKRKGNLAVYKICETLENLKIGEGCIIKKSEWLLKTPFNIYLCSKYQAKKTKFKFKTKQIVDRTGYAVLRIK